MITDTSDRIYRYIRENKQARVHDLKELLKISQVAIHKHLNKLLFQGKIQKVGKPPQVFYVPTTQKMPVQVRPALLPTSIVKYINTHYLYITPQGGMLYGLDGFQAWVKAINEETRIVPLVEEYVKTHRQTESNRSSQGWIDATEKMQSTFPNNSFIKKLLYADFYSIPKFGKTKLGQLVLYAKQSQNNDLIDQVIAEVKPIIERIAVVYNIDTLAFIPPSVPRKLQFMQEFNNKLLVGFPRIKFTKAYVGNVVVAQKTLSRLEERVENARDTIFVDANHSPLIVNNVLLIDDAVGSGATLEETAKKLKQLKLVSGSIIGFAIVGSMKGFEVIREV